MATDILCIPEQHLREVIRIVRAGIGVVIHPPLTKEVVEVLTKWCEEEEEYLLGNE